MLREGREDVVGQTPDYRFTLANERTFLARIRTSLALLAGGVAIKQLVPSFGDSGSRTVLSVLLLLLATYVAGSSYSSWKKTERAMRLQLPLPASRLPLVLGMGLLVTSAAALLLVVLQTRP